MKLRDSGETLEELCASLDADREALCRKLAAAGYVYDREQNRFH